MNELDRLTQLVLERQAAMTLYARQWLDMASAEDAVQEALTALLMQRQAPNDPIAWMFRAVRNAAIDCARSASRRKRREKAVAAERYEWFEPRPDLVIDAETAEKALRGLPADDRQIVVLRIWGTLNFSQIAEIVGLGVSTVHDRYSSALEQMRNKLEKPCRNPTD
jgi:RNA polymerase sigma-70 factor (ECF subfamily)